jgi:hypothetical protein
VFAPYNRSAAMFEMPADRRDFHLFQDISRPTEEETEETPLSTGLSEEKCDRCQSEEIEPKLVLRWVCTGKDYPKMEMRWVLSSQG